MDTNVRQLQIDAAVQLFHAGRSVNQIAAALGVPYQAARRLLRAAGVVIPIQRRGPRGRPKADETKPVFRPRLCEVWNQMTDPQKRRFIKLAREYKALCDEVMDRHDHDRIEDIEPVLASPRSSLNPSFMGTV